MLKRQTGLATPTAHRSPKVRLAVEAVGAVALALWICSAARPQPVQSQAVARPVDIPSVPTNIPYGDARPILEALRETLPPALKVKTPVDLALAWSDWVSRHNEEIRQRLERGDEDSIVNFWYYGTSFTTLPPLSVRSIVAAGADAGRVERMTEGRLQDLIAGMISPGTNERLRFARAVIERKGWDPATSEGKDQVRRYLFEMRGRILAEREERNRSLESAKLLSDRSVAQLNSFTQFRDRGLSSDTSMLSSFTIERALDIFKSGDRPIVGTIRRVAIVGPGLDFTDKNDGFDFYPLQTIQPFAVIDSLIRLGLSKVDGLRLTTFDLSPRIIRHIETARERARAGDSYVLQLPLDRDVPWNPALVAYWRRVGDRIGEEGKALAAPPYTGNVSVRAVSVRPGVVMSVTGQKLNIVLERLQPMPIDRQFDLILATNVLIYYDVFEQSLALANVASMLRPGGLFLSNTPLVPTTALQLIGDYVEVPHTDKQYDYVFGYRRQ
jgi:SAM-dependent methyltransferase